MNDERRHATAGVARSVARIVMATAVLLATLAAGTSYGDPAELEYRGAVLTSPANDAILSSSTGVTFSWSLPQGVTATRLALTEQAGFFAPSSEQTESEAIPKSQVVEVPLQPQQTAYTLPSALPKGVALYWAVSSSCTNCSIEARSYYSQARTFGIADPANRHTAPSYIRRVVKRLGNAETGVEVHLSVKCNNPAHGDIRCHFATPGLDGVAVLSTASGPFTGFKITATQVEGCGVAGQRRCRHTRRWHGTEAQVCSREGSTLVSMTDNGFCESTEPLWSEEP